MKKSNTIISGILLLLTIVIISCSKMNDLHQPYLDEGERIYPGKVDTVMVQSGKYRLVLQKVFKNDPNIVGCMMYWNNRTDSLEVSVEKTTGIDTVETVMENLDERTYLFEFFTFDDKGNRSIRVEKAADVYGEAYEATLINRSIAKVESPQPGIAIIEWKNASPGNTHTTLTYKNNLGEQSSVDVAPEATETILDDFNYGGTVTYQSFYKPDENAIDLFEAEAEEFALPEDFVVDKGNFSVQALSTDCAGDCWGGNLEYLFDGNVNDQYYHTGCLADETDGIPHHFTLDLGVNVGLKRFALSPRTGCCQGRNPKKVQLWGIADIDGAETTLPSGDAGWEDEALSKGWVKIYDGETPESFNGSNESVELNIPESQVVRYIRYRCVSNWNGEPYTALSEITFWADRIE